MKRVAVAVLLLALLVVVACGDDTSPRSADPGPRTPPQPLTPTEPLSAWTRPLRKALAGCERIRVRKGGYYGEGDVPRGRVLFEVEGVADVRRVTEGISIDDTRSDSICMCSGQLTLEFHRNDALAAVLSFHHGRSLRWDGSPAVQDGDPWVHDGALTAGSGRFLKDWLVRSGVAPHLVGRDPPPWAKVAPEQIAEAGKHGVPVAFENDLGMRFVLIPAGTFLMGSPQSQQPPRFSDGPDPEPVHPIRLARPYYLQMTEVTNAQFALVDPDHDVDTGFGGEAQPVVAVSWDDAKAFAEWTSRQDTDRTYRLPTEAEWEYACRAGTQSPFSFALPISTDVANYDGRSWSLGFASKGVFRGRTTEVGTFPANAWGLHDMHGNVWEWCGDRAGNPDGDHMDPLWPPMRKRRIIRGGSWRAGPQRCRSASRLPLPASEHLADLGFRLVSPLPESVK